MRILVSLGATLLMALLGQPPSDLTGTWVWRVEGLNIFKLELSMENGVIKGSLTRPVDLEVDQDGDVMRIGSKQETRAVQAERRGDGLRLRIKGDRFEMVMVDRNHARMTLEGMQPFQLERQANGTTVTLATALPERKYPEPLVKLRAELHAMVMEDQEARMKFDAARMTAADEKNRAAVLSIYKEHGWVTKSLAGKDAAHDFWLLVQHQSLDMQRDLLPALEEAARKGEASMSDYAYLYDRVQVGLGKLQRWGTQVKCEAGKPVLSPVEDRSGLDARRKELGLNPIDEYLKLDYLRKLCEKH